ncbi:MAG: hypothetical protein ABIR32_04555 [Ilumatobacteraceae bacterium]
MSSILAGKMMDPEPNEPTVHDWVQRIRSSSNTTTAQSDPVVATICAAAVDSLEIAASLEASGMSRQVVSEQYGQPDVFALAHELWARVPFRAVTVEQPMIWRQGNISDLGRGALYAVPALLLVALTRALNVEFSWWTLPLSVTWGWAAGQVTAYAGYTLRARTDGIGERLAVGWMLMATILTTAVIASGILTIVGGGWGSFLAATGVTTYMVSSAILLMRDAEVLAAGLLGPGAVSSVVILAFGTGPFWSPVAVVCIAVSTVTTFAAAAAQLRVSPVRSLILAPGDVRMGSQHFAHGLLCGAALTTVAILGSEVFRNSDAPTLNALPLLVTLGVMEWQLRSFRAGVERLTMSIRSIDDFSPMAAGLFRRALLRYVAAIVLASIAVSVLIRMHDESPPYLLLVAQILLGVAFYVDLTLVSLSRLDLVLRSWAAGVATGGTLSISLTFTTSFNADAVIWSGAVVAIATTLAVLLALSHNVITDAMSH